MIKIKLNNVTFIPKWCMQKKSRMQKKNDTKLPKVTTFFYLMD